MYTAYVVGTDTTFPKNYGTGVKLAMMEFNTLYGFTRWSVYFALCFWRMRLKVSRIRRIAQLITIIGYAPKNLTEVYNIYNSQNAGGT